MKPGNIVQDIDGKLYTITSKDIHTIKVNGTEYWWSLVHNVDQGGYKSDVMLILKNGIGVYVYAGDPHDMSIAGIRRAIKDQGL
jgi:hypothetical protein